MGGTLVTPLEVLEAAFPRHPGYDPSLALESLRIAKRNYHSRIETWERTGYMASQGFDAFF